MEDPIRGARAFFGRKCHAALRSGWACVPCFRHVDALRTLCERSKKGTFTLLSAATLAAWIGWTYLGGPVSAPPEKIIFDVEWDNETTSAIDVMNPDGSDRHRLTYVPGTRSITPSWSPDRKTIAFASTRNGSLEIYIMNADGSNVRQLTKAVDDHRENADPDWSPDGRRIVFESEREGRTDVYIVNSDGSRLTRLTPEGAPGRRIPIWSLDGRQIVVSSLPERVVHSIDIDGSNVKRLTYIQGVLPMWSADATRIVTTSDHEGIWSIYVADATGSNMKRLTMGGRNRRPHWSPTGKRIVVQCERPGSNPEGFDDICVMDSDGSNVRWLTSEQDNAHPDW